MVLAPAVIELQKCCLQVRERDFPIFLHKMKAFKLWIHTFFFSAAGHLRPSIRPAAQRRYSLYITVLWKKRHWAKTTHSENMWSNSMLRSFCWYYTHDGNFQIKPLITWKSNVHVFGINIKAQSGFSHRNSSIPLLTRGPTTKDPWLIRLPPASAG